MGTGSSLELPEQVTFSSVSSTSGISSGYHSDSENLDTVASLQTIPLPGEERKKMAKRGLVSRPSLIIGNVVKKFQEREEELENRNVERSPGLTRIFEGFEECKKFLQDNNKRNDKYFESLNKLLQVKMLDAFNKFSKDDQRMVMANRLARIGFVELLIDYYDFVYEYFDLEGISHAFIEEVTNIKPKENKDPPDHGMLLVLTIREILWNFSDGSHSFAEMISKTNIFKKLVDDLSLILEDDYEVMGSFEDMDLFAFNSTVGILHNCARNPDVDKEQLRNLKIAEKLYPFLNSAVYVKMITLLALGNIVTEEEVSKLAAGVDVIDFLMTAINKALHEPDKKEHGFHLAELVDGLASIAQSDKNKTKIMARTDLLPMVVKIIKGKVTTEVLASVKLVWELAFLPANKDIIKKDKALMATLDALRKDSDHDVKAAAEGAMFVLVDKDVRLHPEEGKVASRRRVPAIPGSGEEAKPAAGHIMFSYCWGDKEIVLKIHQILAEEGYVTWIDVNEMSKYSNVLEGMARAVEEAYVILVCFSEKYKNSQNCRTEAEYAYARKKNIVPLKMQRGYNPDGWLGALIGVQFYIEFSPHYSFDNQMQEVRKRVKQDEKAAPPTPRPQPAKPDNQPKPSEVVLLKDWSKIEIDAWIIKYKLEGNSFRPVRKLTGEQLEFLCKVMKKAPETFYRWLETKIELKTIEDLMRFDRAIMALEKYI